MWKLLKVAWRKNYLPESWLVSEGCFIPKEDDSNYLKLFQTILLLNLEGKIFFGILAKRLTTFQLDNNYIDTQSRSGQLFRTH